MLETQSPGEVLSQLPVGNYETIRVMTILQDQYLHLELIYILLFYSPTKSDFFYCAKYT